jgi:hypothetical protein
MTVAYLAYQKLKPQVHNRVNALLKLNPEYNTWLTLIPANASPAKKRMMVFMMAATWPDRIKGNNQYHNDGPNGGNTPPNDPSASQNIGYSDFARHKYWHFTDKPFSQDGTPLQNPPIPNAEDRIAVFRSVLNSNGPDELKSYDLAWLLHLVGDVHQPLHCAARFTATDTDGDDGGNGVNVCDPQCGGRLHGFWDGLLGPDASDTLTLSNAITTGNGLPQANATAAANPDASKWIDESFQLAKTKVYKNPPIGPGEGPFHITSSYKTAARNLAKQRVALAGARLARILNKELK